MTDDDQDMFGRGGRPSGQGKSTAGAGAPADVEDDPLAELIRIVKEEDPFGDLLDQGEPEAPTPPRAAPPRPAAPPRSEPPRAAPRAEPPRAAPRAEPPRAMPRAEPPRAMPRAEPPRAAPRAEPPRATPRSEPPRATPRAEPPRATPRAEPPRHFEPQRPAMPAAQAPKAPPPPPPPSRAAPPVRPEARQTPEPRAKAEPRFEPAAPRFEPAEPRFDPTARAEGPSRRPPPPLDPIDLDQALRDFRDAPEDLLRHDSSWTEEGFDPATFEAPPATAEADAYQDPAFAAFEEGYYPEYEAEAGQGEAPYGADPYDEYDEYAEPEERRPRRGTFLAVGMLLGLAVLGGAAAYIYMQGGSGGDGEMTVIRADNEPAKIAPDDPGGATIPNQDRLVYNRVSGETGEPEATLMPREEEVLGPPGGAGKQEGRFAANGESETASAGAEQPGGATGAERGSLAPLAAAPAPTSGIAPVPRRVKTVVVRPDGSIVTVEPQEPSPVPSATQSGNQGVPTPPSRPQGTPTRTASSGNDGGATQSQQAPGAPLALNSQAASRPATQTTRQEVARAAPPLQPAPSAAPATSGEYVVQLAARRNEQQARQAFNSLRSQYPGLLSRYQPLIQRTDLGQAGIYYRVRVGPMTTAAAANDLCNQLKAAGLPDCLVRQR